MSMLTEEVSKQKMLETIHYMTENFPYRLAGSPCEAAASRYVTERLRQCDVTRSVSKMTEIEGRGGKRWDKPKKAEKSRDCGGR